MHHPHSCKVGDKLTNDLLYIPDALSPAEEAQFVEDLYAPSNKVRWTTLRNRRLVMLGGSPDPKGMLAEPMPDWAMLTLREVLDRRVGCFDPKHPPIACSTPTVPVQLVPTHAPDAGAAPDEHVQEKQCPLPQGRIGVEDSNRDQTEEALRSAALGEGAVPVCPEPNHILINEYVNPQGIMPHEDGPLYHPVVAIYSLESTVALRFERKPRDAPKATTPLSSPVTVTPLQAAPTTATHIPVAHPPQQQQSLDDMYDDIDDDPPPRPAAPPAAPARDTAGTSASLQEADSPGPTHVSVVLEPRSLVIFRGAFYTDYLHRIDNVTEDVVPLHECANFDSLGLHGADHVTTESLSARVEKQGGEKDVIRVPRASRRLSVTLRHVPKVFKSAGLLGLMSGGARGRK